MGGELEQNFAVCRFGLFPPDKMMNGECIAGQ